MNITFRKAIHTDIQEIVTLVAEAIQAMEAHRIFQWDDLYPTKEDFLEDIRKEELYVGMVHERIAVIYALNQECDDAYHAVKWSLPESNYFTIHRLCVKPCFQGMGIAKQTLQHIENQISENHILGIRLDVYSQNPNALALYNHFGYQKVGHADWRKGRFFLMEKIFQLSHA